MAANTQVCAASLQCRVAHRLLLAVLLCASCIDDGWLCACLQSLWKGKEPLQARGAAKGLIGHSRTAAQMSLVAHELLLDALLAGMVAGCVLACVQHLLVSGWKPKAA